MIFLEVGGLGGVSLNDELLSISRTYYMEFGCWCSNPDADVASLEINPRRTTRPNPTLCNRSQWINKRERVGLIEQRRRTRSRNG